MLILPSSYPIQNQKHPMISSKDVIDEKGNQLQDITAINSFKWNSFTVLVGDLFTHICKVNGDLITVVLTIAIAKADKSHPFAYYDTVDALILIVNHKLIYVKTLDAISVKKQVDEQQPSFPLTFIPHFEFEYAVVDLLQLYPSLSIQTIPLLYALFSDNSSIYLARCHPEKLYFDSLHINKNSSNILENGAKLFISNFSSMESSDLVQCLKLVSIASISCFYFDIVTASQDANDEWGFMQDFTDSDEKQISLVFLTSNDTSTYVHVGNLFAGQFQDNKQVEIASKTPSHLFRHYDLFSKSNIYCVGLDTTIVVYKENQLSKLTCTTPNIQFAYFSPNATFLILFNNEWSSMEYTIFKSESDVSARLKVALEKGYFLDMVRFIFYPISNTKQHSLIPNRVFDLIKSTSSYFPFKTLVSSSLSTIQKEFLTLLLVVTRDLPFLKLSSMSIHFILQSVVLFEFFYGTFTDLSLAIPIITELTFVEQPLVFDKDAIEFIVPQVPFILDFLTYIIKDINLFVADKHKFDLVPSHVIFFVHPALVKLMLQLIVCCRALILNDNYKMLTTAMQNKVNLKEYYDLFKQQKEKLENCSYYLYRCINERSRITAFNPWYLSTTITAIYSIRCHKKDTM